MKQIMISPDLSRAREDIQDITREDEDTLLSGDLGICLLYTSDAADE